MPSAVLVATSEEMARDGGGSSAGLRTLPSKPSPREARGGTRGGGTKVEGLKPCYEGKV